MLIAKSAARLCQCWRSTESYWRQHFQETVRCEMGVVFTKNQEIRTLQLKSRYIYSIYRYTVYVYKKVKVIFQPSYCGFHLIGGSSLFTSSAKVLVAPACSQSRSHAHIDHAHWHRHVANHVLTTQLRHTYRRLTQWSCTTWVKICFMLFLSPYNFPLSITYKNPPVLNWGCQLTWVALQTGWTTSYATADGPRNVMSQSKSANYKHRRQLLHL